MAWNNPLSLERVLETVAIADLQPGATVLDVGCGTGELLHALGEQGLVGRGIDTDADAIAQGRADASLVVADALEWDTEERFDLVVCLGATHAYGRGNAALPRAVVALGRWLNPGGWLLLGEGLHEAPIPAEYEDFLGGRDGIARTHQGNIEVIEEEDRTVHHAITASLAEWDRFEWAHFRRTGNVEWRDAWLRWGRGVMGFGLYLAR